MPNVSPSADAPLDTESPVSSAPGYRRFSSQSVPNQLMGDSRLRELLGISPEVLLKTVTTCEPPPLPDPHLTRSSVFPELARSFDSNKVIAVTGYPESGKTVAMSEFAAAFPGDVFWFSAVRTETQPESWFGLCNLLLAQHIGAASFFADDIQVQLLRCQDPLLVVIDNAQNCHDLDPISFLFEAAEATRTVSVLLVGTDEPAFVSAARSRGIIDWRMPGLEVQEARSLLELHGGALSGDQCEALEFLRLRVDGHLGMLRVSRQAIRSIETKEDVNAFVLQISSTLGAGLDSLQSAMIERLREGLDHDEIELCRRLSIVVGPFSRRVGERVWGVDRSPKDFHMPWNGCVVGVFESQSSGKYALPDLYREGFRQEADRDAIARWHGAIADGFEERVGQVADILDIHAAVVHRLLSGDVAAALDMAAMYLVSARGPGTKAAQSFLIRRFELWLNAAAKDSTVPATQRIRWYAICAQVYFDLDLRAKSDSAIEKLYDLLIDDCSDAAPNAVLLGWSIVLIRASTSGLPELALSAVNNIDEFPFSNVKDASVYWREFFVISAFLNSSESPLPYLQTLVKTRVNTPGTKSLWGATMEYEFWRAVTASVYSAHRDTELEQDSYSQLVEDIGELSKACRTIGEMNIAHLSDCLLVHVLIDLARDVDAANRIAHDAFDLLVDTADVRVAAYVHDTLGDARRCSGKHEGAISSYRRALELWPMSELADRAETLLMLAISQAKLGRFIDGAQSARKAARLHTQADEHCRVHYSQVAAARCLLEAAGFCIHGNKIAKSVRYLIKAHDVLYEEHRDGSEWPALAQIAWSIENALKSEPNDPQPPLPGFTLGLGERMVGAEDMVSCAPTMTLARACAVVGRPHRALSLFEAILAEFGASDMQMQIGIMAFDSALKANDLPRATRFAVLGSRWLVQAPREVPQSESFVFDYLIGRAIQLASNNQDKDLALIEIDKSLHFLNELAEANPATQLLTTTLRAYRVAQLDEGDDALEEAFQFAIDCRALWVARDIAWHWCFRFSIGRPIYENQYFIWHWRLCWLSLEIARHDTDYLSGVLDHERSFWDRIPEEVLTDTTHRVLRVLQEVDSPPIKLLQDLVAELATVSCEFFNVTDVARELTTQSRLSKDVNWLVTPFCALYVRLLDLVLHPGAPHVSSTLRGDITSVLEGLRESATNQEVIRQFTGLLSLAEVLEVGVPSSEAFEALRQACEQSQEISENSAAQLYTWLRHFVTYAPDDFGIEEINEILRSSHVAQLLHHKELLSYIRIRLATCHLAAKAFDAQFRLSRALAMLGTQKQLSSPVDMSAVISAESTRDAALGELTDIVAQMEANAAEADTAELRNELWSCYFELGGVRRLTGATLLLQERDESAKDRWLKPSVDDFQKALESAKPLDSSEHIEIAVKAAFSGRTVAQYLDEQTALAEFNDLIEEVRSMGRYDGLIASQEAIEANDILNRLDQPSDDHGILNREDKDEIQRYTDHIMQSTGWPEDRRQFVEDDVRKIARIQEEQESYCRHLQPLQNLVHLQSPRTVYASRTKYTCSCSLLGHETHIELDNIETVMDTMKRVYCQNCDQRSPR